MSHRKKIAQGQIDLSLVEVKSKFEAEFRRFSLKKTQLESFSEFYELLEQTHNLQKSTFSIYYRHPQDGDLLPINNTENFMHALGTATPLLRLFLQRGDMPEPSNGLNASKRNINPSSLATPINKRLQISVPQDFRRVSAIIDVDILPESIRRVRLCKYNSDKPLGFYIRDGTSIRVTSEGLEKVPGIFVSRLVPGGLAESTGLLSVNDEVLEVNGIEVAGKSLDQVTDMMVANSQNLIVTVKPVGQAPPDEKERNGGMEYRASTGRRQPIKNQIHSAQTSHMEPIIDSDDEEPVVAEDGVVHV